MKKNKMIIVAMAVLQILYFQLELYAIEKKSSKLPEVKWSKRLPVEVLNPGDSELTDVPVIVAISALDLPQLPFLEIGHFRLSEVATGEMPLYQVDDLDGDGSHADEIVFLTTLAPGEKKIYYIDFIPDFKAWPQQERFTDATKMPGWESELAGFRSYGAFVIDLFAKHADRPGLMLKTFYNEANKQIYNYHVDSPLGMDILHVGATTGLGAIALLNGDKLEMPGSGALDCQVIVSGPVRSIVKMKKQGWENTAGKFTIERTATVYAHHFETLVKDVISVHSLKSAAIAHLGIGMKKEDRMTYLADPDVGLFLMWYEQSMYDIGEMGLGLYFPDTRRLMVTADEQNNLYLRNEKLIAGKQILYDFVAFGAWKRAGYVDDIEAYIKLANKILQQQNPVNINLLPIVHSN